ncbi:LOW QUALITY PROTEIN: hypothetical protein MAR_009238 [Mya arenaria]|uniref:Uncharacterized protein n=1 Tax=Mya arenaria TaxID=6604 RepID=A0ABY7E151_MYAAR|nr:LOW QUALITY PROTEIN: hypothetical protein MAR_009238 [Mya arenaria]
MGEWLIRSLILSEKSSKLILKNVVNERRSPSTSYFPLAISVGRPEEKSSSWIVRWHTCPFSILNPTELYAIQPTHIQRSTLHWQI